MQNRKTIEAVLERKTIEANLKQKTIDANVYKASGQGSYDIYTGEYTVVPTFENQTLETENKFLTNNVSVEAIAMTRVSNPSGGITVNIGG